MTYSEIRDGFVYRRLIELRSAKIERLIEENKQKEKEMKDREAEMFRNRILEK